MSQLIEIRKKISLLGDPHVGKTSLIRRFVHDMFDCAYLTTMGMTVSKKMLELQMNGQKIRVSLHIWDIMGQRQFKPLLMQYFSGSDGAFIVCDVTDKETLLNAKNWASLLFSVTDKIPVIFLANKIDLMKEAQFAPKDLEQIVKHYGHKLYATSARTGQNVSEAFLELGKIMVKTQYMDTIAE